MACRGRSGYSHAMLFRVPWLTRLALAWLALALAGCASLPAPVPQPKSVARTDVADTPLARIAAADAPPAAQGLSGLRLMPEGPTAFNARIALARRAQKSIDAQYYILQDDATGLAFLRELRDARPGAECACACWWTTCTRPARMNCMHCWPRNPTSSCACSTRWAVRAGPLTLRLALSLGDLRRINRRMHNKLFVADNSLAITGGRNIADEYFMRSDTANFIDMDVLVSGPVVPELSACFDDYWNSAQVRPLGSL